MSAALLKSNIFVDKQGNVKGLHSPFLDKVRMKLGPSTVERASSVEFDHEKQKWEAKVFANGQSFFAVDRDEVLAKERDEIDRLIREGIV